MKNSQKNKLTIGLCLICTGKYDIFLQPLIDSLATHFFPKNQVVIYLFMDKEFYHLTLPCRFSLICIPTAHKPFPYPTLFRYRFFTEASKKITTEFLFYSDVDMMVVGDVGDDILADIIVTRHPGFWNNSEWGSHGIPEFSKSYLRDDEKHRYLAGGFQGGATDRFLEMSRILADNIDEDYKNGYIAVHNDESHLNCFMNKIIYKNYPDWKVSELTPSYCMLPDKEARVKFGLEGLPAIIYALNKDHEELRK